MTAKGHVILANTLTTFIINLFPAQFVNLSLVEWSILFLGINIGSLLPDIDEPNSYIGRRVPFVSLPLKVLGLEHRQGTHFALMHLLVVLIAYFIIDAYVVSLFLYALAAGMFMHSMGDMLTKGGIKGFLFPFFSQSKAVLLPDKLRFYTNSTQEHIVVLMLLTVFALNVYFYFSENLMPILEA